MFDFSQYGNILALLSLNKDSKLITLLVEFLPKVSKLADKLEVALGELDWCESDTDPRLEQVEAQMFNFFSSAKSSAPADHHVNRITRQLANDIYSTTSTPHEIQELLIAALKQLNLAPESSVSEDSVFTPFKKTDCALSEFIDHNAKSMSRDWSRMIGHGDDLLVTLINLIGKVQSSYNSLEEKAKAAARFTAKVVFLSALIYSIKYRNYTVIIMLFVIFLSVYGGDFCDVIKNKMDEVLEIDDLQNIEIIFDEDGENVFEDAKAEPQGGLPKIESLVTLVTTLLFSKEMRKGASLGKFSYVAKNFGATRSVIQNVFDMSLDIYKQVLTYFGKQYKYDQFLSAFGDENGYVKQFTDKVFDIDFKISEKKFFFTVENYEILNELLREAKRLKRDFSTSKESRGLYETISSCESRLSSYKLKFDNSNFQMEGLRQEPVALLLRGAPGVFKTQTIQHISHALCAARLPEDKLSAFMSNPSRFEYNRLVEQEYWDGYDSDKFITFFDDLLQARDSSNSPHTEPMELIRCINEHDYVLHMAELAGKGTTRFTSKFVMATTNSANLNVSSIIDKNALFRRFEFVYTVVPKKEFAFNYSQNNAATNFMSSKIDKSKLPIGELDITSTIPDNLLEFHEYDLVTSSHTGRVLDFDQLVQRLINKHDLKKKFFDQKILELEHRRKMYMAERQMELFPLMKHYTDYVKCDFGLFQSLMNGFSSSSVEDLPSRGLYPDVQYAKLRYFLEDLDPQVKAMIMDSYIHVPPKYTCKFVELLETVLRNMNPGKGYKLKTNMGILIKSMGVGKFLTYIQEDISVFGDDVIELISQDYGEYISMDVLYPVFYRRLDIFRAETRRYIDMAKEAFLKANKFVAELTYHNDFFKVGFLSTMGTFSAIVVLQLLTQFLANKNRKKKPLRNRQQYSKSKGPSKPKAKRKFYGRDYKRSTPQISLANDRQAQDIVTSVIKSNVYELYGKLEGETYVRCGQILFVKGNVSIMPHHFIVQLENTQEVSGKRAVLKLSSCNPDIVNKHEVEYYLDDIIEDLQGNCRVYNDNVLYDQDLVLVSFPDFPPRKDITEFILNEKELSEVNRRSKYMLSQFRKSIINTQFEAQLVDEVAVCDADLEDYSIPHAVMYNVDTIKGDCGSVLSHLDASRPRSRIMGMHVAGVPKSRGYSTIFSREDVERGLNNMSKTLDIGPYQDETEHDAESQSVLIGDQRYGMIRKVEKFPLVPGKSQLVRSNLFDKVFEHKQVPAKMGCGPEDYGTNKDPWYNCMLNYNQNCPPLKRDVLQACANNYADNLFNRSGPINTRRIYTFDEAIQGIEGTSFHAISRKTSVGYPHIMDKRLKKKGKFSYLGEEEVFDMNTPLITEMRTIVDDCIEKASKNIRSEHIFRDFLKDETRPIEKVKEVKTRLISASPFQLLILYRMYFGAFMTWYTDNRIVNQSAIGVNVYSDEWHLIAKQLLQHCRKEDKGIGAGDYSKFDGTEKPFIHNLTLEIIEKFYNGTPEERNVRKTLWLELTNSRHVQRHQIYEWFACLPSGHPLTPIVNNIYNGIAFRYCWMRIFENDPCRFDFNKHVYLITLGDDNIFSVDKPYRQKFNEKSIGDYMKEIGLTYTSETKGELSDTLRDITQVEFLKRSWRFEPLTHRWEAPLQLDSILECLNWTKKNSQADQITRDNVDFSLRELSLHGKDKFNEIAPKIIEKSHEYLDHYPEYTDFNSNYFKVKIMELFI
ncbi:MAG: polymerase protein [Varroa dicistrovirus 2]|nr:MAG: polymerase protein [Varroa dicistrovirus 2]